MQKYKAFTLIELAIVLLVIGILAGLMLRNVGIYGVQTRDAKRKGDLRNLSVNLVQYATQYGNYPDPTELLQELQKIGVANLPTPPSTNEYYYYTRCKESAASNVYNHFMLKAVLEQNSSTAPNLYADSYSSSGLPWANCDPVVQFRGMTVQSGGDTKCDNNSSNNYCIVQ